MAEQNKSVPMDEEPIALESDRGEVESKIQAFGAAVGLAGMQRRQFTRPVNLTGAGATRVRFFHSKLTFPAIDHMVEQINEWLDGDKVEIKAVNQVVGVIEGKKPEPNLIVTVWY